MTQINYTTENRHFKHLSDIQRGKLEQMAKCGTYTQTEMACELGVSQSTVSRELRRGKTRQLDYQRNYYEQYIAVSGARVYKEIAQTRMREIIISILQRFLRLCQKIWFPRMAYGFIVWIRS